MGKTRINLDQLSVESFEAGADPLREVDAKGSSGGGCTVLTTCSPDCCDNYTTRTELEG
jgi:hypothetical protein